MSTATSAMDEVLMQVSSWPSASRIQLARRVLETLDDTTMDSTTRFKGPAAEEVLGMLSNGGTAPTDEECEAILIEELCRKHLP